MGRPAAKSAFSRGASAPSTLRIGGTTRFASWKRAQSIRADRTQSVLEQACRSMKDHVVLSGAQVGRLIVMPTRCPSWLRSASRSTLHRARSARTTMDAHCDSQVRLRRCLNARRSDRAKQAGFNPLRCRRTDARKCKERRLAERRSHRGCRNTAPRLPSKETYRSIPRHNLPSDNPTHDGSCSFPFSRAKAITTQVTMVLGMTRHGNAIGQ